MTSRRLAMSCVYGATEDGSGSRGGGAPPPGYTSPTHLPEKNGAPTMKYHVVGGGDGEPRTWAIIFFMGDEVMSGLTQWMHAENVQGAQLQGIGALSSARFGWFDPQQKAYKNIDIIEQCECTGIIGDVGVAENGPALHVHGAVAISNGSVHGGHLLKAVCSPTMEVFAIECGPLTKTKDPLTTLELFRV